MDSSWGNLTSHYDTTDVISTLSLSDRSDSAKLDPLNFYDCHFTGSPVKNTLFDDMHRNLKSNVKVKKPQHKKKTIQDITAPQAILTSLCLPTPFISAAFMGSFGPFILFTIIYLCVLLRFCRSKTGKCVLDKIWKKKEKEEAPTETQKNEGKVNKESKKT
ncbi:hypothetical protein AK88_04300 [Plasmodium fragile]|uniref:Uncharacterized protein n=1 Tax=Plasmodium fragile TaxID=5857 RepID=A0A0D9QGC8_PLAFR|nr:uncharacterized protein AK88_04300 [Plasmodium fragile]KJP86043.1 hypothetical protein AK88_04300 [Plasmodium fragile]